MNTLSLHPHYEGTPEAPSKGPQNPSTAFSLASLLALNSGDRNMELSLTAEGKTED